MTYTIIWAIAIVSIIVNLIDWQVCGRKGHLMRRRLGQGYFGLAYLFAALFSLFYLFGVVSQGAVIAVVSSIVFVNQIVIILERHKYAA